LLEELFPKEGEAKPLLVPVVAPTFPLELLPPSFILALADADIEVAALKVVDAATAQKAALLKGRLTTAGRKLEEARTQLKRPFLDINKKIDDTARGPGDKIEQLKRSLDAQLVAYDTKQREIAAETERQRLAELKRLQDEADRIKAEQEKAAKELASKAKPSDDDMEFDDMPPAPKTEIEKKIEAVKYAPPVAAPKIAGIAFRSRLVVKSIDVEQLPDIFIAKIPKAGEIRETFCTPWKEGAPIPTCPGVVFEI
jgi:hypothetical protein